MDNGFRGIAKDLAEKYQAGEFSLEEIGKFKSQRWCLTTLYQTMLKYGEIEAIEVLPLAEKQALWEEAKRLSPSGKKQECEEICKALHAFGSFLQT